MAVISSRALKPKYTQNNFKYNGSYFKTNNFLSNWDIKLPDNNYPLQTGDIYKFSLENEAIPSGFKIIIDKIENNKPIEFLKMQVKKK